MDTLVGALVAVILVLPGFVAQELTVRRRPSARADGQTTVQRALFYAVVIQLIWSWDTWHLVHELTGPHPYRHYVGVALWVILVLLVTPAVLGLLINAILLRAESGGRDLNRIHYALGGRDAREAWDYLFQTLDQGAWILVRLVASTPELPVMFIGRYGERARHSQSPAPHDVYFDEVWSADEAGRAIERIGHLSGMWIAANQIESMFPMTDDHAQDAGASIVEKSHVTLRLGRLTVGWSRADPKPTDSTETERAGVGMAEAESPTAEGSPPLRGASPKDSPEDPARLHGTASPR